MSPDQVAAIDVRDFRRALGNFATGVTVVTTIDDSGRAYGLTANSFTSVSLDPPLVLWCQANSAPSHRAFRDAPRFAINILAEDQVDISKRFASGAANKFDGLGVRSGLGGIPLLSGCTAHLECSLVAAYPGGDHTIFVGRVERFAFNATRPLVYGRGRYQSAQPHETDANTPELDADSRSQIQAVSLATTSLADLSHALNEPVAFAISVWGSCGPTIVRWETPRQAFPARLRVGTVSRLLTSATGLAYVAFSRSEDVESMLAAELEQAASLERLIDEQTLQALVAEFRCHRMARVIGSMHFSSSYGGPVNATCVPVFDARGNMVAGLTATASDLDVEWTAKVPSALQTAAVEISRRLGYTATPTEATQ